MSPDSSEKRPPRAGMSLVIALEKHSQERQERLALLAAEAGVVASVRGGVRTTTTAGNDSNYEAKFRRRAGIVAATPAPRQADVVSTLEAKMTAGLPGTTGARTTVPPAEALAASLKAATLIPPPPASPRSATDIEPQKVREGITISKKTEQFQALAAGVSGGAMGATAATSAREVDAAASSEKDDAHLLSWLNEMIYPPRVSVAGSSG